MAYNLTDSQKDLLRNIVSLIRDGQLEEEFYVSRVDSGDWIIRPSSGRSGYREFEELQSLSISKLDILEQNGLIYLKREASSSGVHVTVAQLGYDAVDCDFLDPIASNNRQLADPDSNQVFLVHGHKKSILNESARFLEHLGLDVTILHEQPNSGRTIIEKFVDYSDVSFAIVLLTADDRGGLADAPVKHLQLRARQNVILELGFFLGKLGRNRVCALYEKDVEIPSDYSGVLFTPLDESGAWKSALARELMAAGLPVDLNREFQ